LLQGHELCVIDAALEPDTDIKHHGAVIKDHPWCANESNGSAHAALLVPVEWRGL